MEDEGEEVDDSPPVLAKGRARETPIVAEVMRRGDVIAGWLASGLTPRHAMRRATKPPPEGLGLSRSTAGRYVGHVLANLARDGSIEPKESKRARIIEAAYAQLQSATTRKRAVFERGEHVGDLPDPDNRSAIAALQLIAQLERLDQP